MRNRLLTAALLILCADPGALAAQASIGFSLPNNSTVTSQNLQLVIQVCSPQSLRSQSATLRNSTGTSSLSLSDGPAATCTGDFTYAWQVDAVLALGTNYIKLAVVDWLYAQFADSIAVVYVLPPGSGGEPFLTPPGTGGVRLRPGETHALPFVITNVSAGRAQFTGSVSCTGNVISCVAPAGGSSFTTDSLDPGRSTVIGVRSTVGGSPGTGTVSVIAVGAVSDTAQTSVIASRGPLLPIALRRFTGTISVDPTATVRAIFTLTNPDHFTTRVIALSVTCVAIQQCPSSVATMTLAPQSDSAILIPFTAGTGATGRVILTANPNDGTASRIDTVSVRKTGAGVVSLALTLREPFSGTARSPDLCLSVAAGSDGGVECGDLRLDHALPTSRTMNRDRTPTLTYLSSHARPVVSVPATIRLLDTTDSLPLRARLVIGSDTITRDIAWTPACATEAGCAFNVLLDSAAAKRSTDQYPFTLRVELSDTATTFATASGTITIVNRATSMLGAGWWLRGLERIIKSANDTTRRLWIGGDGATRLYVPRGGGLYTPDQAVARPDTLLLDGSGWTRILRGGAVVHFTPSGVHEYTRTREGYETHFFHANDSTLDSLRLPVPNGSAASSVFRFYRGGDGIVDSIQVSPSTPRNVTRLTIDPVSRRLSAIRENSGDSVRFLYGATTARIVERRDRMGQAWRFEYDSARRVARVLSVANATDTVTVTLCAVQSRTIAACSGDGSGTRPLSLFRWHTRLDGPRPTSQVRDITRFYIGRFGGPDTIIDAVGARTRIEKRNADFPALVDSMTDAAGVKTVAAYSSAGLPTVVTTVSPFGGANAVTSYQWSTKWASITSIRHPTGEFDTLFVDPATGDRLWQRRGNDDSTRVTFAYDDYHRLDTVRTGGLVHATYSYSADLGNLHEVTSAGGERQTLWAGHRGRVDSTWTTLSASPCSAPAPCLRQRLGYDLSDRLIADTTIAPALGWTIQQEAVQPLSGSVPELKSVVTTTFDKEGRSLSVSRITTPGSYGSATAVSTWAYDAIGRAIASSEGSSADSTRYDLGGNPTAIRNKRGQWITQSFDAVGQLVFRTMPENFTDSSRCLTCHGDGPPLPLIPVRVPYYSSILGDGFATPVALMPPEVSVYAYDDAGRMVQADNPWSRIRRSYFPAGALRADTAEIRRYGTTGAAGFNGTHRSVQTHAYDLAGRLLSRIDNTGAMQSYSFDTLGQLALTFDSLTTGSLALLIRVPFRYDRYGRLREQSLMSYTEYWTYDVDGRPITRTLGDFADTITYDVRGKRTRVRGRALYSGLPAETFTAAYNGFGHLVASGIVGGAANVTDEFEVDAFGNSFSRHRNRTTGFDPQQSKEVSVFSGQRLTSSTGVPRPGGVSGPGGVGPSVRAYDDVLVQYDAAGNVTFQSSIHRVWDPASGNSDIFVRASSGHTWTWNFYDGDDRPRIVQQHRIVDDSIAPITLTHEYWYDALGRRVLTRARSDTSGGCGNPPVSTPYPEVCQQALTRTVWAGSALLWEDRRPSPWTAAPASLDVGVPDTAWYGRRRYTQGPVVDAPLAVWRGDGVGRVIFRNWRGSAAGALVRSTGNLDQTTTWPAAWTDVRHASDARTSPPAGTHWWGSLITEQRDATGLLYRRARYYDPQTGRFTQTDPIGLAGGLNLYGYGDGDPVNNADPFGLCPSCAMLAATAVRQLFEPYSSYVGIDAVDFSKVSSSLYSALTLAGMQVGARMGVSQATEGSHADPRHNGCSNASQRCAWPELSGHAADVNEIWTASGRVDIGTRGVIPSSANVLLANAAASALLGNPGVRAVIWPTGYVVSGSRGGPRAPRQFVPGSRIWASHQSHLHISTYTQLGR